MFFLQKKYNVYFKDAFRKLQKILKDWIRWNLILFLTLLFCLFTKLYILNFSNLIKIYQYLNEKINFQISTIDKLIIIYRINSLSNNNFAYAWKLARLVSYSTWVYWRNAKWKAHCREKNLLVYVCFLRVSFENWHKKHTIKL